jgi:hypothetical protein
VYAVDKQIQFSPEGSIQLEEELSQRLHENVAELVRVVKLAKVNEQKLSVP